MWTRTSVILFLFCIIQIQSYAQTIFATETFGVGAAKGTLANGFIGDLGTWSDMNTGTNGLSANNWYVSGEECGNAAGNCGSACPGGDNSLHVSALGGLCSTPDCGAAYDETALANQTNKRAISPTIDCSGKYFIELNFNYIAAQGDDGFWVEYSLDNGTTWSTFTGGTLAESGCCCILAGFCTNPTDPTPCSDAFSGQGYWTAVNLAFPVGADDNNQVKFAFNWSNDGNGFGTDPSVAIDDITLTHSSLLSAELVSFTSYQKNNSNHLEWKTLSELNSSHFTIEHSVDGANFRAIDSVKAAVNSSYEITYSYQHIPSSPKSYYRIKSVDLNGEFEYSRTVFIHRNSNEINLLKHDQFSYMINGLDGIQGEIIIYDLSGKMVKDPQPFCKDVKNIRFHLNGMVRGIYLIDVKTDGLSKHFKIKL